MDIIQQIAVKAVEEIFDSVKITGLSDIGKTIKALTPVVSRMVLSVVTACLEEMDDALVTQKSSNMYSSHSTAADFLLKSTGKR